MSFLALLRISAAVVHEAFNQLKTGRPRPVEIEIPPETLAEEADIDLLEAANPVRPVASAEQIQAAAEILGNAKKLIILAGVVAESVVYRAAKVRFASPTRPTVLA